MNSVEVTVQRIIGAESGVLLPSSWRADLAAWKPDATESAALERAADALRLLGAPMRTDLPVLAEAAVRTVGARLSKLDQSLDRLALFIAADRVGDATMAQMATLFATAVSVHRATDRIDVADGLATWLAATDRWEQLIDALDSPLTARTGVRPKKPEALAAGGETRLVTEFRFGFLSYLVIFIQGLNVLRAVIRSLNIDINILGFPINLSASSIIFGVAESIFGPSANWRVVRLLYGHVEHVNTEIWIPLIGTYNVYSGSTYREGLIGMAETTIGFNFGFWASTLVGETARALLGGTGSALVGETASLAASVGLAAVILNRFGRLHMFGTRVPIVERVREVPDEDALRTRLARPRAAVDK